MSIFICLHLRAMCERASLGRALSCFVNIWRHVFLGSFCFAVSLSDILSYIRTSEYIWKKIQLYIVSCWMGHRCRACAWAGRLGEMVSPDRRERGLLRIEVPIKAGANAPLTRLLTILAVMAEGYWLRHSFLLGWHPASSKMRLCPTRDPRLLGIFRRLKCLLI